MTSTDGITWVDATPPVAEPDPFFHLAAAGDRYLAISTSDLGAGDGSTTLAAWVSPNGRDWTSDAAIERGLRAIGSVNGVIGAGDRFVVVGDSGEFHEIAEDGSLVRIEQPTTYGGPVGGEAGLAWLGPPDEGPCLASWLRSAGAWRSVEPYPNGCAVERDVARRIALPDGWLIVASSASSSDEIGLGGQAPEPNPVRGRAERPRTDAANDRDPRSPVRKAHRDGSMPRRPAVDHRHRAVERL